MFEFENALSSAGLSLLQVRSAFRSRNFIEGLSGLLPDFVSKGVFKLPPGKPRDLFVWAAQPFLILSGRHIPGKSGNRVLLAQKPL